MRTTLALWVAILCIGVGACKQEVADRLTDANIRQAITTMNDASMKFDAGTICNMIDGAATITLKEIKFSGPQTSTMNKDQYCGFITAGMAAMKGGGVGYETTTVVDEITIAPDGMTAEVKYSQTERLTAGGRSLGGSFAGNSTLAWRDGRVMMTSVRGVVRVAQ